MTKKIEFKKIKEYESYTIYLDGRIYSDLSKRFINGHYDYYGYKNIQLYKNEIPKSFKIHQLIAKAFIPNPENKPNINHINGVKDDNRVENLEWCTQKENIQHAWDTGLNKTSNKVIENNNNIGSMGGTRKRKGKKSNGHKPMCGCPICKNMRNGKRTRKNMRRK